MQYTDGIYLWTFVYRSAHFFGKKLTIATKTSVVDVAEVLNPFRYTLTWIAYVNNLIQVSDER